jgi:hypothetical protein
VPRPSRLLTFTVPRLLVGVPVAPRRAVRLVAAVLTAAALAGCGGVVDAPLAVQPPAGPPVPDVVGKPLDVAKSSLDLAGFTGESQDMLRDRDQFLDTNWVVCTQNPGPVPAPVDTVVELGVVKDVELCPGTAPTTAAAATTTAATTAPAPTSRAAAVRPAPRPAPAPDPEPADEPDQEPAAENEGDEDSGGGSSAGTVHPGSFCDPPGTGVSKKGKPMVCAPGSDGRNRWQGA